MRVVALAGGTGSAKILRGLAPLGRALTVIANVGDNAWIYGVYVCPDVDIAVYTLAGIADRRRGWGIEGDSTATMDWMRRAGEDTWFELGDRDLATCVARTMRLARGESLSSATAAISARLGVRQRIMPATDDPVGTRILTPLGDMHLQEFWVRHKGRPRVLGVRYAGAGRARPSTQVKEAISDAEKIIVCPANPITSIGPILAIRGMRRLLAESKARKVALSPMVGDQPVSGPAGKLLRGCGVSPNALGVAGLYGGFLDSMVVDSSDAKLVGDLTRKGLDCVLSDIIVREPGDERRLARELLRA